MDKNLLKIIPTTKVTRHQDNAYQMMTILDPLPHVGDSGITQREIRLFTDFESCFSGKKNQYQVEGDTFHTTTVFTSLGLLYNLCMCKQLKWKSDGSQ